MRKDVRGKDAILWMLDHRDSQAWDEYWYVTFWILNLQGDEFVERRWRQWQQDWITVAKQWDAGMEAHAKVALSISKLVPRRLVKSEQVIRGSAAAIQTRRFREYRLYSQLRPDGMERPELKAPPVFQLTPAQEDTLFRELERRGAFSDGATTANGRRCWNKLRDIGLVWDPDYPDLEVYQGLSRCRWSLNWS